MKKSKKLLALLTALSISATAFAGLATTAFAAWTGPQYGADVAVHSNPAIEVTTKSDVSIGGETVDVTYIGSVSGGIEGATPGEYNDQPGGTVTFKVTEETAGDYDVTVTAINDKNRKLDAQVGDTVYHFTGTEGAYGDAWTVISDEGSKRELFTYTFEDIALAAGENSIMFGTNESNTWGTDIVGIDVAAAGGDAEPTDAPATPTDAPVLKDGITYADGVVTVKTADAAKAVLIYAQYSGEALSSVKTYPLTFTDGVATQVLKDAVNGSKLMAWTALSGDDPLMPVCDALTVTNGVEAPTAAPATDEPGKPTDTPEPKPTIDPSLINFKLDFEDMTELTGWTSQYNAAGMTLETSRNAAINKYYSMNAGSGSGQRGSYYTLPDEAKQLDENQKAVVEFDFMFPAPGLNEAPQVAITGSDAVPIQNGLYAGDDAIVLISGFKANEGDVAINEAASTAQNMTSGYKGGDWAHVKAVMDFQSKTVLITITSLDGATTYFDTAMVSMGAGATAPNKIFVNSARGGAKTCVDNIVFRKLTDGDVAGTYYQVKFDVNGVETVMSAKEGDKLESVPDPSRTGYIFDGWAKDGVTDADKLMTSEQVQNAPVTANATYTAVYHRDPEYIEPLEKLEFSSFPTGGIAVAGADPDTAADNPIQVKLIGEIGGDLLNPADDRVKDLKVEWKFDGFRTMVTPENGTSATTGDTAEDKYCDDYATVIKDAADPTKVNFSLRGEQGFNFYGRVTATVTYYGKTMEISAPMAVLQNKSNINTILPKPGYVADFNCYADEMVGYQATTSGDNKSATDIITDDWAAYGGNSGRGLYLQKDDNGKFLKLKSTGANSSSFAVNHLSAAPTGQFIISQDVRFYSNNSSILFKQDNPVTWKEASTTISLNFTGTEFNMGNGKICDATTGVWYHIILSGDVTSGLCYAIIYDAEGNELGRSDAQAFVNAGATAPVYLCYRTPDNSVGELDFNNVKIYTPEIAGELTTTIDNDVISIPEGDEPSTANLTVKAVSTEGYDMIGKAEWTIAEEPTGVKITPDATDTHKAVLSVDKTAQGGEIAINVSLGGKQATIPVTLTSSQDSVTFTQQVKSISIPLTEGAPATATYKAHVVNKDNQEIANGANVTYSIYDKNNTNKLETMPKGVTFNTDDAAHTATLSVDSTAEATVVYIRATGTNTEGESISRSVRVDIHGLAFDFGTDTAAEGYTAVTTTTAYSDTTGYGIKSGTPTAAGEGSAEDADSDNLAGAFEFDAKVEAKKVYKVTVTYKGMINSEAVAGTALTGVQLFNVNAEDTTTKVEYIIPVIDDIMDLAFASGSITDTTGKTLKSDPVVSSIVIEKQGDKLPGAKPNIYTVGDSTIANNGSWAYVLNRDQGNYPELGALATFSNNGRGGKQLANFYSGGEFRDRVLSQVRPGDYVMIGDMGTNGMSGTFKADFEYYIEACEALGAKVILNSYSPHGAVGDYSKGYDSATHTFTSYRQDAYDNIVREIYAERSNKDADTYDENIVGFVDIGKMADAAFNAYVAEGADDAAKEARAQEIIKCFGDHNHYSNGTRACQLMIEGYGTGADAKGIVKTLVEILTADLAE